MCRYIGSPLKWGRLCGNGVPRDILDRLKGGKWGCSVRWVEAVKTTLCCAARVWSLLPVYTLFLVREAAALVFAKETAEDSDWMHKSIPAMKWGVGNALSLRKTAFLSPASLPCSRRESVLTWAAMRPEDA